MSNQYRRTIVIGMDYSEFSGGITEINRKMGLLDAEFRRATAEATLYGTETEKLQLKQDLLRQKIELQKKKIEEVTKTYNKAVDANGEMSAAAERAQRALINQETALLRLQTQLSDTENRMSELGEAAEEAGGQIGDSGNSIEEATGQLEEAAEESRSFGDTIRDVAEVLGVETNPAIEAFAGKFDGVNENAGKAILTIGTLVTTLGSLTLSTADSAKEISNVSQRMGMTTDQYQEWDYVMKMVGSDAESMTGDIAALAEKAVEATDKTSDTAKTFRMLGINVRDSHGSLKSQNELFGEVIDSLRNMTDETQRNAIASDLLSTTGENIIPVLNMTKEEYIALKKEAHDTGYVMGEESIEKFGKLKELMTELKDTAGGLSNSFATVLLPVLSELFAVIASIPTSVLNMMITLAGIIATMYGVGKATSAAMDGIGMLKGFMSGLDVQTLKTIGIIWGVVAALVALGVIIAAITGKGDDLSRTVQSVGDNVAKMQNSAQKRQSQMQYGHYATGTDYAPGGRVWAGENGPEIIDVPVGSRIINAEDSKKIGGGDTYILQATISAKDMTEFNDVINFMQQTKQAVRAGRSKL